CVGHYSHPRVPPPRATGLPRFFLADFPATLAATAWLQAVVAVLLIAGALVGATLVSEDPTTIYACIPSWMHPAGELERLVSSQAARDAFLKRAPVPFGFKTLFSTLLFTHNMQVGLAAFASGILAGIPTLLLAFYNGITLGAFATIFANGTTQVRFWAWLLPHAVPELLAITLCSTGGLLLGKAVVAPGRDGIARSLREAGRPALELVIASILLFIIAATIESFVRQSMLSTPARFAAAGTALVLIVAYCWYVRRLARQQARSNLGWLLTEARPGEVPGNDSTPAL